MGRCPSAKQPYVPRPSDCGQPFTQESGGEPVPQLPSASSWVLTACGPGETLTLNGRLQAKHLCTADRQQTELFLAGRSVGTLTRYPEHGALALRHSALGTPGAVCFALCPCKLGAQQSSDQNLPIQLLIREWLCYMGKSGARGHFTGVSAAGH